MKRFIALILSLSILAGVLVSFAGCSTSKPQNITMGQWLTMVNDAFGMDSYVQQEPYYSNIVQSNRYFEEVQIAAEWEVISTSRKIDVNKMITWKDVLVSLVNAGAFLSTDSSDNQKIEFAIKNFDPSIRKYWMNREIQYTDAVLLLATAQRLWANRTYTERVEEVKFKDGVKDFSSNKSIAESYKINGDTTIFPAASDVNLNVGDVYVLPSTDHSIGTKAFKVEKITHENGQIIIQNSDDIDLYDIAEDIFLQETIVPSIQNTVFYDPNGNVLFDNAAANLVNDLAMDVSALSLNNSSLSTSDIQSVAKTHKFKVGDWDVALSYSLDGTLSLDAVVKSNQENWDWEVGVGLDNVKVTNEIDFSWFKLKSASVRVDYETNFSFKASTSGKLVDKVAAPYNNGNGKGLTNLKKAIFKDSKQAGGTGAQTIKLFSMDVWSVGVARVCLDVNFVVKVDGTFEITITNRDTKGVEYKNNNIRFINSNEKDITILAKAKIEATLGIGPALYTIGLKKPIIGVQGNFGAGASASIVMRLVDSENHLIEESIAEDYPPEVYKALIEADITTDSESVKRAAEAQGGTYLSELTEIKLRADVCIDIAMYWIVRLEITGDSYAASLLKNIPLNKEFLGEKNGKFGYAHIENFDFISGFSNAVFGSAALSADQCTKKYTPFDNAEENEKQEEQASIIKGDSLVLSEMHANITVGQKYYLIVQKIPKGYELKDLKIKVDDTKIASVDQDGVVVGKKAGSTIVRVYTADNKYSVYCAITVSDSIKVELNPLNISI